MLEILVMYAMPNLIRGRIWHNLQEIKPITLYVRTRTNPEKSGRLASLIPYEKIRKNFKMIE